MARKLKVTGSIPEEIVYISGASITVNRDFDDLVGNNEDENVKAKAEVVVPAFVSDANNAKTIETGIRWAGNRRYYGSASTKEGSVKQVQCKNEPMSGIRIVTLEIRSEGGRAYKVITPNNHYVDLREDILLELMISKGIKQGGIIEGEYIWAKVGSQMKLVRVGSELHEALIEATDLGNTKKIPTKELKIGSVYETKRREYWLYLGKAHNYNYQYAYRRIPSYYYGYNNEFEGFYRTEKSGLLFWQLNEPTQESWKESLGKTWRGYDLKSSHTMLREVATIKPFAENFFEDIHTHATESIKASIKKAKDDWASYQTNSHYRQSQTEDDHIAKSISYYADILLLTPDKQPIVVPKILDILEKFNKGEPPKNED